MQTALEWKDKLTSIYVLVLYNLANHFLEKIQFQPLIRIINTILPFQFVTYCSLLPSKL